MFELVVNLAKIDSVLGPDSFSIWHGDEFSSIYELVYGGEVE
jgi:hypothetical protein